MLYQLAYMSQAAQPWLDADLEALLAQSRDYNAAHDLSGVLLYREGRFLQLLEGERDEVEQLYARIGADPRHRDVARVWEVEGASRWFGGWSMAFRDLEDDPVTEPAVVDVLPGGAGRAAFTHDAVVQLWQVLSPTLTDEDSAADG